MYCESKIRYAESPRYLVLSWRLNPPYLIYTTACALTALAAGRSEFLDVAFALALIAFVATAAFAAFLERKVAATNRRLAQDSIRRPRMTPKGEVAQ